MGDAAVGSSQRRARFPTAPKAGLFQKMGVPTVICGPGDIAQAHRPNEFVALDQLARCERFVEGILEFGYAE